MFFDFLGTRLYIPRTILVVSIHGPHRASSCGGFLWFKSASDAISTANSLRVVVDKIVENYSIDKSKIFWLGYSEGSVYMRRLKS